jgi:nicotinate-nucleotide pyrophosphorylase (carboxylating)
VIAPPPPREVDRAIRVAFDEDLGATGDVTTAAVVDPAVQGVGRMLARRPLVVCGLAVARAAFTAIDPALRFEVFVPDGVQVEGADAPIAMVEGSLASILTAERVALNFVQRLSGVATWTRAHVDALGPSEAVLVDTRKTTPGLRALEKYAVRAGGARNHRFGLGDGVMIKDNHIAAAGGIEPAVARARGGVHHLLRILVEVEDLAGAVEAAEAGADVVLLDNFDVPRLSAAAAVLRARFPALILEASGNVGLDTVAAVGATGVHRISSGGLVHQARWVDISLEVERR